VGIIGQLAAVNSIRERLSLPTISNKPSRCSSRAARLILKALMMLVALAVLPSYAADQKTELTYSAFRAVLGEQTSAESAGMAAELFFRVLGAQGRVSAARQSLDRVSGWYKAAQARLQAQNVPPSDVELLRFAQVKAAARVAQFETERLRAVEQTNLLLKRPASTPFVALMESPPEAAPQKMEQKAGVPSTAAPQDIAPDFTSRKAALENELLPLGNELLGKMYQSYLFGGIPLTSLLWQEQEVYEADLEYRLLLLEAAKNGDK